MEIPSEWRILLDSADINNLCDIVANELNIKFANMDVVLVGILKGAMPFLIELSYRLKFKHSWQFIEISSYKNSFYKSEPKLITQIEQINFIGKTIILVDELLDSGETMKFATNYFKKIHDTKVYTCVAMRKNKPSNCEIDFCGLSVPDVWLVGFGLDHKQNYRNLKAIYAVPGGGFSEIFTNRDFYEELVKTLKRFL